MNNEHTRTDGTWKEEKKMNLPTKLKSNRGGSWTWKEENNTIKYNKWRCIYRGIDGQ